MKHIATPAFWRCFDLLPVSVQIAARAQFKRMKENPAHPSLHLKKIGRFTSVRIGLSYRALAVEKENILT
jgi:hypothetical protein